MEKVFFVYKADECGWLGGRLGHVVDLQPAALVGGRLDSGGGHGQHVVELTGGNAHAVLVVHEGDELVEVVEPLTGLRGDEDDGRIGHEGEVVLQLLAVVLHGLAVFFVGVPLVDRNDAGLPRLVCEAGDLAVLFGEALEGVDHDDADVCPFNGHFGPDDAVFLNALIHPGLPAQAGGVNEQEGAVLVVYLGVGGVAGGAGNGGHDGPLLSAELVDERALADVRLADDGDLNDVVVLFHTGVLRQVLQDGIQ